MLARLRRSFAAKLVVFEVGTIIVVSVAVATLLVSARLLQTHDLEQRVAVASADGLRTDLATAGANAHRVTQGLATFPALRDEFGSAERSRMDALVTAEAQAFSARRETLVTYDSQGIPLLAREADGAGAAATVDVAGFTSLPAVAQAVQGHASSVGLIEPVAGRLRLDTVSAVQRGGVTVGFIADSQDVQEFLSRVVRRQSGVQYSVYYRGQRLASTLPGAQAGTSEPAGLGRPDDQGGRFGTYRLAGHTYAGYFARVEQGEHVAAVADVDDAVFAAQSLNDVLVVLFATTLLATLMSLVAVFFARRTAIAPLRALSAGAERLGGGDYSASVPVDSQDDFGRLAGTFNQMAAHIRENTAELERQRARLDAALTSLGSVSRALTATTAGEARLREAVLEALLEMTGADAVAMYEGTERVRVTAARGLEAAQARKLLESLDLETVLVRGESISNSLSDAAGEYRGWSALAVPMVYQGTPAGLLAAYSRSGLSGVDVPALAVLANQAVVAVQNSVLFERERETVARLQQLDGMKADFLATIQHELRTPLTAIMGMTDLMQMAWGSWGDQQKLEALSDVQVSAKNLYEIVETILDYSMLESSGVRLTMGDYGLRQIAEAAVEDLRPLIRRSDVNIDIRVPASIKVSGDGQRLAQVMKALVDNAVKFSPKQARVQVRAEQHNGRVQLQVIDRGIGIAPQYQEQIFDRFFQVDNTATRRYGGTGMGLALVKQLVELQHGRVTVESAEGKGSTFTVTLPSARPRPRRQGGAGGRGPRL
ncbi:MAG: ATP-binding protein [Candidatus Dormibacteraeota bacterium]|nr:ATP-binding protein [Candidatus Dormibacteraeota bacterium]